MKIFVQTISGITALIAGVSFLYFFISRLSTSFNVFFLIISIILICVGGYLFFKVSKIENTQENSPAFEPVSEESGSKLLDKNNQIVKDWSQANSKKENLKAVQMAVSAEATIVAEDTK